MSHSQSNQSASAAAKKVAVGAAVSTTLARKVMISVVAVLLVLAGALVALACYYYGIFAAATGEAQRGEYATAEKIDPAALAKNYRENFSKIVSQYLALAPVSGIGAENGGVGGGLDNGAASSPAASDSAAILTKTRAAKDALLALIVPADARDTHLESVIKLTEIEDALNQNDLARAQAKQNELRTILNNF